MCIGLRACRTKRLVLGFAALGFRSNVTGGAGPEKEAFVAAIELCSHGPELVQVRLFFAWDMSLRRQLKTRHSKL